MKNDERKAQESTVTAAEVKKQMEKAAEAALEGGRKTLEVYDSEDFDVQSKDDKSPLTLADKNAHDAIAKLLETTRLPVLSEEGADIPHRERASWDMYWLVDPLDGTKEFIKRNGEFTVNIALMAPEDGEQRSGEVRGAEAQSGEARGAAKRADTRNFVPVGGVVYVPAKDLMYIGIGSQGAWKIEGVWDKKGVREKQGAAEVSEKDERVDTGENPTSDKTRAAATLDQLLSRAIRLPQTNPSARPFSAVMSRSHNSPETEELVSELEKVYGPAERVSSGSSIKLCLVAEGTADIYPRLAPTMEWDTAAGDAVCRAAGCRVTEHDGRTALRYNKEDLHNPWFLVLGPGIEVPEAL